MMNLLQSREVGRTHFESVSLLAIRIGLLCLASLGRLGA